MREPARNQREALDRYKGVLQRSLGLVTKAIWTVGEQVRGRDDVLFLKLSEDPLRLVAAEGSVYLSATQAFTFERSRLFTGELKVATLQYAYSIGGGPSSADMLASWHWHPGVREECHVHMYQEDPILGRLHDKHLPTSRVSLEQIIRFLIVDLGVRAREGWQEVLEDTQGRFDEYKSWGSAAKPK